MNKEEFINEFPWCDRQNDITGYNNSYITVKVFNAQKDDVAAAIYVAGLGDSVMWPEYVGGEAEFDIHKGNFVEVQTLSRLLPNAVIFASSDWEDHTLCLYINGKDYDKYRVEWLGNPPEPYEDDDFTYYDCDVKVTIMLPDGKEMVCYCGGGMCTQEEFDYYESLIRGTCNPATVRGLVTVSLDKLREPSIQKTIREIVESTGYPKVNVTDPSLYQSAYWEVEFGPADEGVSLKTADGKTLFSWGFDEKGEWFVNDNAFVDPKKVSTICRDKETFFEQLIKLSDSSVHTAEGLK